MILSSFVSLLLLTRHVLFVQMAAKLSPRVQPWATITQTANLIARAFIAGVGRLDTSLSPRDTINRLQRHAFTLRDSIYIFHLLSAVFWLTIMKSPGFPLKLFIPLLYTIALLVPLTSQFFVPATPSKHITYSNLSQNL